MEMADDEFLKSYTERRMYDFKISLLLENQFKYIHSLPNHIKDSLAWYTDHNYREINAFLRSGGISNENLSKHINNIKEAFKNVPPVKDSFIVYRGQKEKIFDTKGFTSTSTSIAVASAFTNMKNDCCLYIFTISAGSKVLPLKAVSTILSEFEILLDVGSKFNITLVDKVDINIGDKKNRTLEAIHITSLPERTVELVSNNKKSIQEAKKNSQEDDIEVIVNVIKTLIDDDIELFGDVEDIEEYIDRAYTNVKRFRELPPLTDTYRKKIKMHYEASLS